MTPKNSETDRSYELEARWKQRVAADARDCDDPVLEPLSQRLEDGARELR